MEKTLSERERAMLLRRLHGYLVWVGAEIPKVCVIDERTIPLRELIWRLINKKELTDGEISEIESLIHLLERKESCDEAALADADITEEEAENLYDEAAGILRAIIDLKEIGNRTRQDSDLRRDDLRKKIRDAKGLLRFADKVVSG